MDIDNDFIRWLAELGFIAGGYGMIKQTDAIVGALTALRPDSERPYLIQALTRINGQDAAEAEHILREQALKANPNSAMAKACLGLALHVQGRINERDHLLNQVLTFSDDDEDAVNMARQLLETRPG